MLDVCAFFESFQDASSCRMRWAFPGPDRGFSGGRKKQPASMDLQASQNPKGLQDQRFPLYFSTRGPCRLTILISECGGKERRCRPGKSSLPRHSEARLSPMNLSWIFTRRKQERFLGGRHASG